MRCSTTLNRSPASAAICGPGIVHRLDRDTSGVLVVARTDQAHRALAEQFQTREVEKVYLALVHGQMETIEGHISRPISRDPVRRTRMTARFDTGRSAYTEFKVLERFEFFNYLEVRIGTGRTHQIRAHLAFLKHPVVGDSLYGAPKVIPGYPALNRFFLHAHRLRFRSPSTDEWITVESPLAPELQEYLALVRRKSVLPTPNQSRVPPAGQSRCPRQLPRSSGSTERRDNHDRRRESRSCNAWLAG